MFKWKLAILEEKVKSEAGKLLNPSNQRVAPYYFRFLKIIRKTAGYCEQAESIRYACSRDPILNGLEAEII